MAGHGVPVYGSSFNNSLGFVDPTGLATVIVPLVPMSMLGAAGGPGMGRPGADEDFVLGLADGMSLGIGNLVRKGWDAVFDDNLSGQFNQCSDAYRNGGWASVAIGGARLGYAGLAKGGAVLAASGVEASAFRQGLKTAFRLGLGPAWRSPNLARYATDEALRAAAGRTNSWMNLYGFGTAAAGATSGSGCGCGK